MMRKSMKCYWDGFRWGTPGFVLAVAVLFLIMPGGAAADDLTLSGACGSISVASGVNSFSFSGTTASGLTCAGTVSQTITATSDLISISPLTVTNNTGAAMSAISGTITVSNTYSFTPPTGPGIVSVNMTFDMSTTNPAYAPFVSVEGEAEADTLEPGTAYGTYVYPIGFATPTTGSLADATRGSFFGQPGTLTGIITINDLTHGSTITFPGSADFMDAVPEPSSLALLVTGLLATVLVMRKRIAD